MKLSSIAKYVFSIRTRSGVVVGNLAIFGSDEEEARRKLLQMYFGCEVLDCFLMQASPHSRHGSLNYEDVVELISAA